MSVKDLRKFFIDGEWVGPISANDHAVENPATEETVATISFGTKQDVDRAVTAARRAFESYSQTPVAERIDLLETILAIYKKRYDEMAWAISTEMGAPISMSKAAQAAVGVGHIEGFLEALREFPMREELSNGNTVLREPVGVCGLITPWNWPVNQIALKVIPALAAGCTMVLKPSELTPLSAHIYAEILAEAGVPKGVFNLVNGEGAVVGAALSRHPDVNMMSFTGSTRGGTAVLIDSAPLIKRVTLELGGKSPNLIFADADVEDAVTRGVGMCFYNTGQSCDAPTRMLVERSVYDRAVDAAKAAGQAHAVGDPGTEGDHLGPLVSRVQFDKVQGLIEAGVREGATLLCGGLGKPEGLNKGHFVRPTIFANVSNDMTIAREEIFGPVLSMIPFDNEDDAVRIANETAYGLAAYIETGDPERAERVARRLRAGQVKIKGTECSYGSPFGGYKASGLGREGGRYGLEDFLEVKAIARPA